jgi:osmotically-inducible protein OsmY
MSAHRTTALALALGLALSGCSMVDGRSAGQVFNDVETTTRIKSRLAATEGWSTLRDVSVETQDDWVELRGQVPDQATRERIERVARRIAGDNRVVNHLEVEPGVR